MEWFSSLFQRQCASCGKVPVHKQSVCLRCLDICFALTPQTRTLYLETSVPNLKELELLFLGPFEGVLKDLIHLQKTTPSPHFTRTAATLLTQALPPSWTDVPLLWVPARAFQETHLVEHLTFDFETQGVPIVRHAILKRALLSFETQKKQNLLERKTNQARFQISPTHISQTRRTKDESAKVILLDDVVTSGSTLRDCAELVQRSFGARVIGAVSLAYTELK